MSANTLEFLEITQHEPVEAEDDLLLEGPEREEELELGSETIDEVLAMDTEMILGACVIPRFKGPNGQIEFGILFENKNRPEQLPKFRFGFVFGRQEPGETILETGGREHEEEIGIKIKIEKRHYLGILWVKSDDTLMPKCYVVFLVDVPWEAKIKAGPEQKYAFRVPRKGPDGIDDLVAQGVFFKNHEKIYKKLYIRSLRPKR